MPTYATDTARAVAPGAPAPGPCRSCAHARTRLRQLGIDSQPGVGSDAVDERIPERHGVGAPIRRLRLGRSACEEDDDGAARGGGRGARPSTEIAVARAECDNLPVARFGESDSLRFGQWVLALGSPSGFSSALPRAL
jgi:hypothetical protein